MTLPVSFWYLYKETAFKLHGYKLWTDTFLYHPVI